MRKVTAQEYYDLIKDQITEPGQLFFLTKTDKEEEYLFNSVIINPDDEEGKTVRKLQRVMDDPKFVAFPGTPEMEEFIKENR